MLQEKNNSKTIVTIVLAMAIFAFIIAVVWIVTVKFPIDYDNGNAVNSTVAENNAKSMIQAQTVPTIVNGIATSTSIIIGFSATLIGLFFREVVQEDKKAKEVLIIFCLLFVFSFVFLFFAYFNLANGGQNLLENAWRNALFGLIISLFLLLFVFLFFAYTYEQNKAKKVPSNSTDIKQEEKEKQIETDEDRKKIVNITINM